MLVAKQQLDRVATFAKTALACFPVVESPVEHVFTPGLYIRRIHMVAGSLIVSKIHKTEHPYVITSGVVTVWTPNGGSTTLRAPHHGITKPGTVRILYVQEDTVWTTYHPTSKTTVAEVEDDIIDRYAPLQEAIAMFESQKQAALTQ